MDFDTFVHFEVISPSDPKTQDEEKMQNYR